jgi:hypothetical protein
MHGRSWQSQVGRGAAALHYQLRQLLNNGTLEQITMAHDGGVQQPAERFIVVRCRRTPS